MLTTDEDRQQWSNRPRAAWHIHVPVYVNKKDEHFHNIHYSGFILITNILTAHIINYVCSFMFYSFSFQLNLYIIFKLILTITFSNKRLMQLLAPNVLTTSDIKRSEIQITKVRKCFII